jgi:hypothetical protein
MWSLAQGKISIAKYKQNTVKQNSVYDFIKVYFLHCFVQRHVSALVMSHLQGDYFFLVRQNIQLAMLLLLLPTRSHITYIKILS